MPITADEMLDAAFDGNLGLIKQYVQEGGDMSVARDPERYRHNALHYAAEAGQRHIVEYLLLYRHLFHLDINARTEGGDTALFIAAWRGKTDVVKQLLIAQADPAVQSHREISPFHIACREGHTAIAEILYWHGADINRPVKEHHGFWSMTPMMSAADGFHAKTVKFLLDIGVPVDTQNEYGETALYYAVSDKWFQTHAKKQ